MRRAFAALLTLFAMGVGISKFAAAADTDIDVKVNVDGDVVRVDASLVMNASLPEVWAVMTDFDHMARFISNLKSSSAVAGAGNLVTVSQTGEATFGPMRYKFESVREIRLWPMERVQSRMLTGNMKRFEGTTLLVPEATGTRVHYHSEAVPKAWIPPLIGVGFIERETREQFAEFRVEVMRRASDRSSREGEQTGHFLGLSR